MLKSLVTCLISLPLSLSYSTDYDINDAVDVFTPGEDGYPCIRIPAITQTTNNTLVAFAECRGWTGDGCNPQNIINSNITITSDSNIRYICQKQSFDNGKTWSNLSLPFGSMKTNPGFTTCQPTVVYDIINNKLILNFNGYLGQSNQSVFQSISTNNGNTWSTPINIGTKYLGPKYSKTSDVGPGRGIQLISNSSKNLGYYGRLLFIAHQGAYVDDIVWYSDDYGETYNVSETLLNYMDEAQLVELSNGSVLANMRNNHYSFENNNNCDCRGISISNNGGKTFTEPIGDNQLISPVCMASIISVNNNINNEYALYFSNPDSTSSRINMTVKKSIDNGKTWNGGYNVFTGPSAYSCLTTVNVDGYIGLLWETNSTGCSGESCRTVFSLIPM